ncbi:MAG: type II secretion system protein GspK [Candidatus Dependentiae bacterium]|nr:type II secretion system protein GspK [Candidatus Dependentiae bacterium]
MHKKPGFILFLLFSILSMCSVILSLYFSQTVMYRQLMTTIITKQKTDRLALGCVALAHNIITAEPKKKDSQSSATKTTTPWAPKTADDGKDSTSDKAKDYETLLKQIFPYFNKQESFELTKKDDGVDAKISITIQSEQGKLNLNSLYDIEKKKFVDDGKPNDRKKICVWLFEKIAQITKTQTLFPAFEKHLSSRKADFNDVTELLSIKEFETVFHDRVFFNFNTQPAENLFLTDIFTVSTEEETINPWLFSYSWCKILGLKPKQTLTDEEKNKLFKISGEAHDWATDWKSNWENLATLYQKEYKDLAQEIKTILTPLFEVNIFSLQLKANIKETSSTIFTIVRSKKAKNNLVSIETMKTYQI